MVKYTYTAFLREQWRTIPLISGSLHGRSILLTGANVGLGHDAAKHLAKKKPARLLLTAREMNVSENTCQKIGGEVAAQKTELQPLTVDLSSFKSVIKLVETLEQHPEWKVDTIVFNAAKATRQYSKTEDGWETTLQVNYLSNVLLCLLLVPQLLKNASTEIPSRIIFVSTDGHHFIDETKIPLKTTLHTLNDDSYSTPSAMRHRYPVSKTLLLMFARELSARLPKNASITVMSVSPGFCHSSLTRESESTIFGRIFLGLLKSVVARTTEVGSRTIVHAVAAPDARDLHGKYIASCQAVEESDFIFGDKGKEVSDDLWNDTLEVLSKVDSRVGEIIASLKK
ncbi:short-chain dehydrogenase [Hysterangium stoloniferum]|nr:short-chain dehydrogenase [Hysterangium stoloniferum]